MYSVSAQGVVERIINVRYYYYWEVWCYTMGARAVWLKSQLVKGVFRGLGTEPKMPTQRDYATDARSSVRQNSKLPGWLYRLREKNCPNAKSPRQLCWSLRQCTRSSHSLLTIRSWTSRQEPDNSIHMILILIMCCWFFLAYLYSTGTQHEKPAGWPILLCGPTQEPCVSHSQHRRNRERFWKKIQVNGPEG